MKAWISIVAMALGLSVSGLAQAQCPIKWVVLDPVDIHGNNNDSDDAYWVGVYQKPDLQGVQKTYLQVAWSGATYELNPATQCFDGIEGYSYCLTSASYELKHDGAVVEAGSVKGP